MCDFADRLAYELIHSNFSKEHECISAKKLSPLKSPTIGSPRLMDKTHERSVIGAINQNLAVELSETNVSPLTSTNNSSANIKQIQADAIWLQVLELHKHVQQQSIEATGRKIRRHCAFCKNKTGLYCSTCNVYCCSEMKN